VALRFVQLGLAQGTACAVSVKMQPSGQICTPTAHGSGVVATDASDTAHDAGHRDRDGLLRRPLQAACGRKPAVVSISHTVRPNNPPPALKVADHGIAFVSVPGGAGSST
jgi:hypothetical protein